MQPIPFSSVEIFIPKVLLKLVILLNGWFEKHISLRKLVVLLGCLLSIHVLFMQDYLIRNNLWNLVPLPLTSSNMLLSF